jgi:hypothetical protein
MTGWCWLVGVSGCAVLVNVDQFLLIAITAWEQQFLKVGPAQHLPFQSLPLPIPTL